MKKVLKVFLSLVMIFVITGCDINKQVKERKPVEVLNDALENETSIDEIKVDMSFNVAGNYNGVSYDSNINTIISAWKEENNTNVVFELSDNPLIGALKGYISITDTEMITYIPSKIYNKIYEIENDVNTYVKTTKEIYTSDETIDEKMTYLTDIDLDSLFTDDDFYLVNRTGDYGMYRLVISKELLDRIEKSIDSNASNDFEGNFNIDITINEKNNRLTEISCDLSDFIKNNIDKIDLDEKIRAMIQKISFDFKIQYSNIDTTIPSDIINNSMPAEEYYTKYGYNEESYLEEYDYNEESYE